MKGVLGGFFGGSKSADVAPKATAQQKKLGKQAIALNEAKAKTGRQAEKIKELEAEKENLERKLEVKVQEKVELDDLERRLLERFKQTNS